MTICFTEDIYVFATYILVYWFIDLLICLSIYLFIKKIPLECWRGSILYRLYIIRMFKPLSTADSNQLWCYYHCLLQCLLMLTVGCRANVTDVGLDLNMLLLLLLFCCCCFLKLIITVLKRSYVFLSGLVRSCARTNQRASHTMESHIPGVVWLKNWKGK